MIRSLAASHAGGLRLLLAIVSLTLVCDGGTPGSIIAAIPGEPPMTFALHTTAFSPGGDIPSKHTCSGADVSPPLSWSDPPARTQALALIMDDPDAPSGTFTHWVLYDLDPKKQELQEGVPKKEQLPGGALQGKNDFGKIGYGGPCPPPGKPHRYFFRLYALDGKVSLKPAAARHEVEAAIKGHVLAQAELMGKFRR
jgi:Raf kinase inhibitor-like YbhB/YbcL family protein